MSIGGGPALEPVEIRVLSPSGEAEVARRDSVGAGILETILRPLEVCSKQDSADDCKIEHFF